MEYLNKLKKYLEENKAEYKLLNMDKSVATSTEAAKQMGERAEDIVKSVVFYKQDKVIAAIVRKSDRVDKSKIAKALNLTGISLCSPEETLEKTGYPAGGVPPLGFKATFLMDEKAAEKEEVIAGGGNDRTLIKIKTQELLRLNRARILDLRKEDGH
ncbi:MAG: YbaK/EbsC family protein [Nanoarchaeota archaeon]|nr:YbaK/EbsC family protein [Nanoarchaeota archaeon]